MNTNFENRKKDDKFLAYEAINTSNADPSNLYKESVIEQQMDQINLKIEKEGIIKMDNLLNNKKHKTNSRRIGNLRVLKYNSNGDPIIVIGPHWPFYICLSTTLFFLFFMFFYFVWDYLSLLIKLAGLTVYSLQFISYTYVFLINPGIPKNFFKSQQAEAPEKMDKECKYCNRCNIILSKHVISNHCNDCDVCIIGIYYLNHSRI